MRGELASLRVRLLFCLILLFAVVIISRLYFLQIVSGEMYSTKADRQYLKPNSSALNRGTIYFRTKDNELVTAANQKTGYTLAINPTTLADKETALKKISEIIAIDKESFLVKAAKAGDPYEEVAKKIELTEGDKIQALKIPGVNVYKEKWRFYPNDSTAANVLGIMAFKGTDLAGRYGLEQYYEDILKRSNDSAYSNFFVEMFSNIKKTLYSDDGSEGDIVTSIEPAVQTNLERETDAINKTWDAEYTGGIVIDPKTGEVIAMSMSPSFNPNDFKNEKNPNIFSNKLVEDSFELGSVIKTITMAAGIDSGAVTAHTTYFDTGSLTINNKVVSNFDKVGRGLIDMQRVFNESLNTGAVFVVRAMGKDKFVKYMGDFGLTEKSGIDLPNESAPLVNNLKSNQEIDQATASYGQGIALSPILATRAFSVLANGGVLIHPHIVTKINYKSGITKDITFSEGTRVLKKETTAEIARMLTKTVDEALVGGTLKLEHYSVAAKSGTAQIALKNGKGYYDDRYLHSFVGYFPAYDPRFLVFLFTYYPKNNARYASDTLAKPLFNIIKYLINYYEIPPDR
jgi:cell division protein FtsI/penicillin-binding protein 2